MGEAYSISNLDAYPEDYRVAIDIGRDFAFYGVHPPEDVPEGVLEGFDIGIIEHQGVKKECDAWIMKWLHTRTNAYRREKYYSEYVTPEYLHHIDRSICPVTGEPLTSGLVLDTDWSIDRVINDGAYAVGNLVVMSVRANQAKGPMTLSEITRFADYGIGQKGLSAEQWQRMSKIIDPYDCLYSANQKLDGSRRLDGQELMIDAPMNPAMYLQNCLSNYIDGIEDAVSAVIMMRNASINTLARRNFNKLWHRLLKRRSQHMPGMRYRIWASQSVRKLFDAWYDSLKIEVRENIELELKLGFVEQQWPGYSNDEMKLF